MLIWHTHTTSPRHAALLVSLALLLALLGCAQETSSPTTSAPAEQPASQEVVPQEAALTSEQPLSDSEPTPEEPVAEQPADLQFSGDTFVWDAEGDGNYDTYFVDYLASSDDAPAMIEVTRSGESSVGIDIPHAYGIESLRADTDEQGPYLVLRSFEGDDGAHDAVVEHVLRLVDGVLVSV